MGRSVQGECSGERKGVEHRRHQPLVVAGFKQAEEAIRFQAALLEAVGEAIIATDLEGVIVYWNEAAVQMYGWSTADAIGRKLGDLVYTEETIEEAETILESLRGGQRWSGDFWVKRRDGSRFPAYVTDTPVSDQDGQLVAIIGVSVDVTERKAGEEARRRLSAIVDGSGDAILGLTPEGVIVTWNPAAERLFGYSAGEIIGQPVAVLVPAERSAEQTGARARLRAGGPPEHLETRWRRKDGSLVDVLITASPAVDEAGDVVGLSVIAHDITRARTTQRALEASQGRLALAQRIARIGSFELDLVTFEMTWSDELCRLLGLDPGVELTGDLFVSMVHPDDWTTFSEAWTSAIEGRGSFDIVYRIVRADSQERWVHARAVPEVHPAGTVLKLAGTLMDDNERVEADRVRQQAEQELAHQVLHDSLTGLANRALLTDRLVKGLAAPGPGGSRLGVIFLDVDHFKVLNDSLGHTAGDAILCHVAARVAAAIRPSDTLARFGGDEFVVVCEDVSAAEVEKIAERVLEALSRPWLIRGQEMSVTASLGIAIADDAATPETVLRQADAAMYRAKERGRGRIELFDEALRSKAERRSATASDLRTALDDEELIVHYQPVVDLTTGIMVGAEALLRWQHPARGLVSPDDFIPLAEETGLIVPIGAWVLEQACLQLVGWQRTQPSMWVAVNLSVRQVAAPDIEALVADVLERTGVSPEDLWLELTESVFMDDVDHFAKKLANLKALGVYLAIDDFGTGYSSLSYLKRFPIDAVKVDRAFVDGLGTDPHDTALVAAIMAMAGALELGVTAEGVETPDQLANLKRLSCNRAQGYYLARPMPAASMAALVGESHRCKVD